jgi:hypothetical protein
MTSSSTFGYTQRDAWLKKGLRYHEARGGKLILCKKDKNSCPIDVHISREEYLDRKFSEDHPKFDPDVFYARPHDSDPFKLRVVIGGLSVPGNIIEAFMAKRITEDQYFAYVHGEIQPRSCADIYLVRKIFEEKEEVVVPAGSTIRTTNPKYKRKHGAVRIRRGFSFKPLHVNTGSEGYGKAAKNEADEFQPVSITWVDKHGYFSNIQITDDVLKANVPEATDENKN